MREIHPWPSVTRGTRVAILAIVRVIVAIAVVAAAGRAVADPSPPATAADVAAQPRPGGESGRTDMPDGDSALREAGRAALFVPKLVVGAAVAPIDGALWMQDRYKLDQLYYKVFFNDAHTIGLYPTATYTSGYGVTGGVRFVDRDLFGAHEWMALQATTGYVSGEAYRESFFAGANTGHRLGRLVLAGEATFDRRPDDPFFGIGNTDLTMPGVPHADPRELAVATHYRYQEARAASYADARVVGPLHARLTGAVVEHGMSRSTDGPPIDEVYDPGALVGWSGFTNLYGELELRIDERRTLEWEPPGIKSNGWLAAATIGRVHDLDAGGDFWRGTAELQDFIHLAKGPRLLALRLRGEAVSGSAMDIPLTQLPMLGGGDFLRGYDFERFRDKLAALGSAEYIWDLSHWFAAAVFVDAGRVYDGFSALELDHLRVGYGAALEVSKDDMFLFEASIASSIDGGLFLSLSFNPVFDARPRWR